jgi:SAM-dependent methyltransferase
VAVDAILEGLGDPSRLVVADVGAGTGISARLFAERGARVIAIEPNAAMRDAAEPHALVAWRDGTGEATGLSEACADLVICAQAFHWFRQPEALVEFHRILRPGGRLAIFWNTRDRRDPLTLGYVEAIHAVQGEHPAEQRPFDPKVIHKSRRFMPATLLTFPHAQVVEREGLLGRATSASYVPREGPHHAQLEDLLTKLWDHYRDASGRVTIRYVTKVYLATRREFLLPA